MWKTLLASPLWILLTCACDESSGNDTGASGADVSPYEVGWDNATQADSSHQRSSCLGLAEAACGERAGCVPLSGGEMSEDCSVGVPEFAGCWSGFDDQDEGEGDALAAKVCAAIPVYGRAQGSAQWFVFPEACVPDGWKMSEGNPYPGCAPR